MSAVPVAALVLGGTWALPSSVAFIFSAKAGPAKAIAAPSASVTSMVLFDMVFLPVDVKRPCQPQNNDFPNLFPIRRQTPRNFVEACGAKCVHTDHWCLMTDR